MTQKPPDRQPASPGASESLSDPDWYHGSPLLLDVLLSGSTVTRHRHLAEVFASKPTLVCLEDDGRLRHNGQLSGWLYRLAVTLGPADLVPHPHSAFPPGHEWLTTRPLRLERIGPVNPRAEEQLDAIQIEHLQKRLGSLNSRIP